VDQLTWSENLSDRANSLPSLLHSVCMPSHQSQVQRDAWDGQRSRVVDGACTLAAVLTRSGPRRQSSEATKEKCHSRAIQTFHKISGTQPRSIAPPICSSFRVNVAENQRRVNEQFSKALFCSKISGAQTHEAVHDSNEPSIALSGPPSREAGPFGHSGWFPMGERARGHLSR